MISHVARRALSAVIVSSLLIAAPLALSESLLDIYEGRTR
jgi:hypothetical protein